MRFIVRSKYLHFINSLWFHGPISHKKKNQTKDPLMLDYKDYLPVIRFQSLYIILIYQNEKKTHRLRELDVHKVKYYVTI